MKCPRCGYPGNREGVERCIICNHVMPASAPHDAPDQTTLPAPAAAETTVDVQTGEIMPLKKRPRKWRKNKKAAPADDIPTAPSDSPPHPPPEAPPKRRLLFAGRYELVRQLGQGRVGQVHLVRDTEAGDKELALKLIEATLTERTASRERLEAEVYLASNLDHPNIVKLHDILTVLDMRSDQERWFLTMDYVEGQSLREMMTERFEQGGGFPLTKSAEVIYAILDALEYAHRKMYHGDLKPEDVLISSEEGGEGGEGGEGPVVKVTDFGLSRALGETRVTRQAVEAGQADYLAPEQIERGAVIGPEADLYSVAVILYEMLTGQVPKGMAPPPSKLAQNVPDAIDEFMARALAVPPEDRFPTVARFKNALSKVVVLAEIEEEEAEKKQRRSMAMKLPSRRIMLAAGASLALAAGVIWWAPWSGGVVADPGRRMIAAVERGDLPKIRSLARRYPRAVNARGFGQRTPLHYAAALGHLAVAEELISRGGRINVREAAGYTPLHWAAGYGRRKLARMLLARGADVSKPFATDHGCPFVLATD